MREPSVYRPIILRSLKTAWSHRELWIFALLASFAGTGVIVNDVLKQARLMYAPTIDSIGTIAGDFVQFLHTYFTNLITAGESKVLLTAAGAVLVLVAFATIVVASQQIVLVAAHRAVRRKKRLSWREILRSLHHVHFLRVFGIDALFRLLMFIIMTGTGLLLRELVMTNSLDALLAITIAAATLFLGFALNIIAMFALIGVAREELSILSAIHEAIERLLRHPLISFEVSALLFAANLVLSLVYIFGIAIIAAPIALLFAEALNSASYAGLLAVSFGGIFVLIMWTAVTAGFTTTFTYCAWTELIDRLERLPFHPRIHHYSKKLLKPTK